MIILWYILQNKAGIRDISVQVDELMKEEFKNLKLEYSVIWTDGMIAIHVAVTILQHCVLAISTVFH